MAGTIEASGLNSFAHAILDGKRRSIYRLAVSSTLVSSNLESPSSSQQQRCHLPTNVEHKLYSIVSSLCKATTLQEILGTPHHKHYKFSGDRRVPRPVDKPR